MIQAQVCIPKLDIKKGQTQTHLSSVWREVKISFKCFQFFSDIGQSFASFKSITNLWEFVCFHQKNFTKIQSKNLFQGNQYQKYYIKKSVHLVEN